MLHTQPHGGTTPAEAQLSELLDAACRVPSLHNSQPWAFRVQDDRVEVHLDRSRLLHASDPDGREARIACAAVVFNLRLLLIGIGVQPSVTLLPAGAEGALAIVRRQGQASGTPELAELRRAIPQRRTNRRPFVSADVPLEYQHRLATAVQVEGAVLHLRSAPAQTGQIQRLAARAHAVQLADPAWVQEWNAWTHRTGTDDGVPSAAAGPAPAPQDRWTLRDFGTQARPERIPGKDFEDDPLIAIIATDDDSVLAQLRAGQALQRMLLSATAAGLSASFVSQLIEVPAVRRELRTLLGGSGHPQVVLRLGYGNPTTRTPRRAVAECLIGP